jgi:hypothetical protein
MRTIWRRRWLPAKGSTRRVLRGRLLLLTAALFLLALLGLAACGASAPGIANPGPSPARTFSPQPTPSGTATGTATGTPGPAAYAYLFSRIDYPLQVPVGATDSVTLTLSPNSNILTVTPGPGSGTGTLTNPIPLPTDLQNYEDIGASVATSTPDNAAGPIGWALLSAPRHTLLAPTPAGAPRSYVGALTFQWRISATAAGQNTVNITLSLYYVYLDHSEHEGAIQISQAPIPIVAAESTPLNTSLPPFKLPLAGLTSLAGIFAVVRFIMGAVKTYHDITDPVKDVATAAQAIRTRVGGGNAGASGSTASSGYPNPWARPPDDPQWGPPVYPPPPQGNQGANRPWPPRPQ